MVYQKLYGVKLNRLKDGFWYVSFKIEGNTQWQNDSRYADLDLAIERVKMFAGLE